MKITMRGAGCRVPRQRIVGPARRVAAALIAGITLGAAAVQPPASAEPRPVFTPPTVAKTPLVPVDPVKITEVADPPKLADASDHPAPVWPAAAEAIVELAAPSAREPATSAPQRAAGLPVLLSRPGAKNGVAAKDAAAPGRVRVKLMDHKVTTDAGIQGLLLRVGRPQTAAAAAAVDVTVDYRAFRTAFGGDWASRLRFTTVGECALAAPAERTCTSTELPSRNNPASGTVTATVPLSAGSAATAGTLAAQPGFASSTLVALTAAPAGPAGSFAATSLTASSTWSAGGSSGNFGWEYPMRVPPPPGGPAPTLSLSYSSQSVDGRHAASNNQPGWVGEGFEASVGGFIERSYKACAQDMAADEPGANNSEKTGDLCWGPDNAVLSLGGHSGELIYNSSEDRWHLRSDDGSRIRRYTGAANGDNNGEYWIVTTSDGTEYWFGAENKLPGWTSGTKTNSAWTAPVYGNHTDEQCHQTAFADSACDQAWRWNLDYVVDVNGNSASYWYNEETNWYARNKDKTKLDEYVRSGWLDYIDYSTRRDGNIDNVFTTAAPARVSFGTAERCKQADCAVHDEAHWPDTPWDQQCTEEQDDCDDWSPTFWSTRRLATITTQIRNGSAYDNVERWTLTQGYPDPGDGTRAGLWLEKISHEGLRGGSQPLPDVEFGGIQLNNRVDTFDFAAAMNWWRLNYIKTETGATTSVLYSKPQCMAKTNVPTEPATNTLRCYPVRWTPEGYASPVTDYFHKYVVDTVYEADNTGGVAPKGSPRKVTKYTYVGNPAWHYADDNGLVGKKDKTWSQWRGYSKVGVTVGDAGEQAYSENTYFRGMYGDKAVSGTKGDTVPGTGVPTVNDEDAYAGMSRQSTIYNGPDGAAVSTTVNEPWRSAATASRTINGDLVESRYTRVLATHERVARDGGRADRIRSTRKTYDSYGMPTAVDDAGDTTVTGDETCTKTTYEPRNIDAWLTGGVHRAQAFATTCALAANPATLPESQVISDIRNYFDDHDYGAVPTRGLNTKSEQADTWNAGNPTFKQLTRAQYDAGGRLKTAWDARDKATTSEYTPGTGLVTQTVSTNPLGHTTTTTVDPAWGVPTGIEDPNLKRSEMKYDPLGRLTSAWKAGRDKNTDPADLTFSYDVRNNAPSAVGTSTRNTAGKYLTSYTLYDGLLRNRQTQAPSATGGRLLTDTFYDTAGRPVREQGPYAAAGAADKTLNTATDRQDVPNQTRTVYDGAGRTTDSIFEPHTTVRWSTHTNYGGDRVDVTPPAGGTATSNQTDALGRTVSVLQYKAASPTGDHDTTAYKFDRKGNLETVTDAAGNHWDYTYDLLGRELTVSDPDKGPTTNGYDDGGRLTSTLDARGTKLIYQYDDLNRKTALLQSGVGTRARWTYDTVAKGQLTQSTRYVGTASYTRKIDGYNDAYQPTSESVTIPSTETGLSGTYAFDTTFHDNGMVDTQTFPQTADLPVEPVQARYDENTGLPTQLVTTYNGVASSYVSRTDYNALGQVEQYVFWTGLFSDLGKRVYQHYSHELETGRLTGVTTEREASAPFTLRDSRYSFDEAGNITSVDDAATADKQCFHYDYLRRLTEAWTPATEACTAAPSSAGLGGPAPYWQSWTYDVTGNRKTQTEHATVAGGPDKLIDYRYPAAQASQPHTLTDTTTTTGATSTTAAYSYDNVGNTLTRPAGSTGSQTLTWDPEGHVETNTDAAGTTTYVYDADGNRLISKDPAGKTLFLPSEELRYTTASGAKTATRYYGLGAIAVASRNASGLTWLSNDHQGTAQVAVRESDQQAVVRRQTPFGQARGATTGPWPNARGFVNGTNDGTGLTHLGAREYDPAAGRFISVDPMQDLQDPQQWNAYNYANNSPVTNSDPDGLVPLSGEEGKSKFQQQYTPVPQRWSGEHSAKPGSWLEYYRDNVKNPPKTGNRVVWSDGQGYGVTKNTLFGAGAVYDKDGNLLAEDDMIRSGGGQIDDESSGRSARDVEPRVIRWFEKQGLLKPGNTLYISLHAEAQDPCDSCKGVLARVATKFGIKIVVAAPGISEKTYGGKAPPLQGPRVKPNGPFKASSPKQQQGSLFEPGEGTGGKGVGGAGVGIGMGLLDLGSFMYFTHKYGPCAGLPVEMSAYCGGPQPSFYIKDGVQYGSPPA